MERKQAAPIHEAYNEANWITPESIACPLEMWLVRIIETDYTDLTGSETEGIREFKSQEDLDVYIGKPERDRREAASDSNSRKRRRSRLPSRSPRQKGSRRRKLSGKARRPLGS
jgi:excinuclease ABC subunit B